MPSDSLLKLFAQHNLAVELEHVCHASPYIEGVLERHSDVIADNLESGQWLTSLQQVDLANLPHTSALKDHAKLSDSEFKRQLRKYRNIHSCRILWHDLTGRADWQSVFRAQSDLADQCVHLVLEFLHTSFTQKYQSPCYDDGKPMRLCIVAMGKWGGQELNFSSDIDFICVYAESGEVDGLNGRRGLSHHEYFTKMTQGLIQILDDITADGFVYRCDTRLRPFGDSGALVVNLPALEQYLLQHGREWERYAYLKARCVSGDENVCQEFEELRRPFVYRRYLDFSVFSKLRDMHAQITVQVKKLDTKNDLKLGRGGIRECEFLIQAMQLLRGGRTRSLQQNRFIAAYEALHSTETWQDPGHKLLNAYVYLRLLENRLQGLYQQQTHALPELESDQKRLARAMGVSDWQRLMADLKGHRDHVENTFNRELSLLGISSHERPVNSQWREKIEQTDIFTQEIRKRFLRIDSTRLYKTLSESSRRVLDRLIFQALEIFLEHQAEQVKPAQLSFAAGNFLGIIRAIGNRPVYFDLLVENPSALRHLLFVCLKSDYLCQQITLRPVLLDELLDARVFEHIPARDEVRTSTLAITRNNQQESSEQLINDLVNNKHMHSFRIAAAEIFNRLPLMQVSDRLSDLAEASLMVIFERVLDETLSKFSLGPLKLDDCGFAILAYGKLGGLELSYTSDLDIVFLFAHKAIPKSHVLHSDMTLRSKFYTRLTQQIIRYLDMPTTMGRLYEVDTRLRPSGNSGFLVSSIEAFARYLREEAWTWEHQALSRARVVLGSTDMHDRIEATRQDILTHAVKRDTLKKDVINMRQKMRQQFDKNHHKSGMVHLKQSPGGMIDLEFLVQYLILQYAAEYPELIVYSDNIRQLEALAAVGLLTEQAAKSLIEAYIKLREKVHLLSLQSKKPMVSEGVLLHERKLIQQQWLEHMHSD